MTKREKIKACVLESGVSVRLFAKRHNVSESLIRRIMDGNVIREKNLQMVYDAVGIDTFVPSIAKDDLPTEFSVEAYETTRLGKLVKRQVEKDKGKVMVKHPTIKNTWILKDIH